MNYERRCQRNEDSKPWCPYCGDSLTTVEVWKDDLSSIYAETIDHHEYYCIGCDVNFVLVDKTKANTEGDNE